MAFKKKLKLRFVRSTFEGHEKQLLNQYIIKRQSWCQRLWIIYLPKARSALFYFHEPILSERKFLSKTTRRAGYRMAFWIVHGNQVNIIH